MFASLETTTTAAYNSTMLGLIYATYTLHRLEFSSHIRSMVLNYITTVICLIFLFIFQLYGVLNIFCLEEFFYMAKQSGEKEIDPESLGDICEVIYGSF